MASCAFSSSPMDHYGHQISPSTPSCSFSISPSPGNCDQGEDLLSEFLNGVDIASTTDSASWTG